MINKIIDQGDRVKLNKEFNRLNKDVNSPLSSDKSSPKKIYNSFEFKGNKSPVSPKKFPDQLLVPKSPTFTHILSSIKPDIKS
mmetsp:Transcript_31596/g.27991  ORF Transcript_31596/g.27991 Transcript_31596/m.27991 type:complete len:83 (+) Transcript_31596:336-584(+)